MQRIFYTVKSIESYRSQNELNRVPFIVLENLLIVESDDLLGAKTKATSIANEGAQLIPNPILFTGELASVKLEGIRSVKKLLLPKYTFTNGLSLSYSIFIPGEGVKASDMIEQSHSLRVKYLGESSNISFEGEGNTGVDFPENSEKEIENEIAPWDSAHLLFSLTSLDKQIQPMVLEEVVLIDSKLNTWAVAESIGAALAKTRQKASFQNEIFDIKFEGVRQAISISGPDIYSIPTDPTEATYSKFEIPTDNELSKLLNSKTADLVLLPSSLSHIQLATTTNSD